MQYPIIDLIVDAYLNNGWTGLDIVEGKNLFNIESIDNLYVFSLNDGIFTNVFTDTRTFYQLQVQSYNGSTRVHDSTTVNCLTPGRYSVTIDSPNFTSIRIKHNGESNDMYISILLDGSGIYTISLNVIESNPTVIGGIILDNIQVENGAEATQYEPYSEPKSDFPNRLKLPLPHYFPHPVIDALQRAAAGTQTADDTEVLRHYLTPLGIGGI